MPDIIPFVEEHIYLVETEFEFSEAARRAIGENGVLDGYSLIDEDDIVACAGVSAMWDGVAEGWIVLSAHAAKHRVSVARYTERLFDDIMKHNNLWRIQASIHTTDEKAIRFAQWLDFEYEGVMRKFGPDGSDYFRYARVV
jgi:RimJ/RimL family protein N-acetyltransferase|tara:strand:+ start:1529 stop:1951 length:423 start_codon:yes stop_codon:yes gene_type:complete